MTCLRSPRKSVAEWDTEYRSSKIHSRNQTTVRSLTISLRRVGGDNKKDQNKMNKISGKISNVCGVGFITFSLLLDWEDVYNL